jgi:multiple sugar transport system ATP-binding protein
MVVPAGGAVGLRPEDIQIRAAGDGQLQGTVELVEALGAETLIHVATSTGARLVARQNSRTRLQPGNPVGLSIDTDAAHLFDGQGRLARPATGGAARAPAEA